jgi:hypothetical protein
MHDQPTELRVLLAQLDQAWRRLGVPRSDRRVLAAELAPDLQAAAADGHDPGGLLTPDVGTFARHLAEAHGVAQVPSRFADIQRGGLLGAVLAVVVGAAAVTGLQPVLTDKVELSGRYPVAGAVLVFGLLAAAGLVGCLVGIHLVVRGQPAAGATVRRAALFLPPMAAAGVGLAVALGKATDYSDAPAVVLTECGIVIVSCAVALVAARRAAIDAAATRSVLQQTG